MSFTKLNYDPCAYQQDLGQSMRVGRYRLDQPFGEAPCFYEDPTIRLQKYGGAMCMPNQLVDLDSEMLGITRKASKCPEDFYPANEFKCHSKPKPSCLPAHQFWTEPTRLSNPPCTLRCTGGNRWDWLPCNPQDKALIPFPTNTNTDILFRDNHRPIIPTPMTHDVVDIPPEKTWSEGWLEGQHTMRVTTTWRTCDEVRCL